MKNPLLNIPNAFHKGERVGITSVCSAHPIVIEAALRLSLELGRPALIEATCNQVNQDGGYTGMTPTDFRGFVEAIAERVGLDTAKIILGGDHLGPNPWKHLPAEEAMTKAEVMIAAYAQAGFTKLHLDTSMGCLGEPVALPDEVTAERAARLAAVAEKNKGFSYAPVYVIGTEVPVPGGALEELDHLEVTEPGSVAKTYEIHRAAFERMGLTDAFERVIALVVQPGVEFGHTDVVHYDPALAQNLSCSLKNMPSVVFEAHSTDYQTENGLQHLVTDGFAILKVGPWLTFALREALYGLDCMADVLATEPPRGRLMETMDEIMQDQPDNWRKYYSGDDADLWLQRHFSYSDRIRYYWPSDRARAAVSELKSRLDNKTIPGPLVSQFLGNLTEEQLENDPDTIQVAAVQHVLKKYERAIAS